MRGDSNEAAIGKLFLEVDQFMQGFVENEQIKEYVEGLKEFSGIEEGGWDRVWRHLGGDGKFGFHEFLLLCIDHDDPKFVSAEATYELYSLFASSTTKTLTIGRL